MCKVRKIAATARQDGAGPWHKAVGWEGAYFIFMPMLCMMKAKMSAVSSKRFESGLPPPWPALLSMRQLLGLLLLFWGL